MDTYPKKGYHVAYLCTLCSNFSSCFDSVTGGGCIYVSDDFDFYYEYKYLDCDNFVDLEEYK